MITPIRSINIFSNKNNSRPHNNKNLYNKKIDTTSFDSVSFSGKTIPSKLSQESVELIQNFAKKLQLNKIYKFENPNVEKFEITSIASPKNSETRTLILQYSDYSKNNMTKHLMCTIKDTGEIIENGNTVKNPKEIDIYEQILPAIITHASKELKVKFN